MSSELTALETAKVADSYRRKRLSQSPHSM
jgi:hypothetical protein